MDFEPQYNSLCKRLVEQQKVVKDLMASRRKAALEEHKLNTPATQSLQRERGIRTQPGNNPIERAHSRAQEMRNA